MWEFNGLQVPLYHCCPEDLDTETPTQSVLNIEHSSLTLWYPLQVAPIRNSQRQKD